MSYSYFASDELVRSLEANADDDDDDARSCSGRANVNQNTVTTAGNHMLREASKSFHSNPDVQTFSALHLNPAVQTGIITGIVRLILPCRTFTQPNGKSGFVQMFIICGITKSLLGITFTPLKNRSFPL